MFVFRYFTLTNVGLFVEGNPMLTPVMSVSMHNACCVLVVLCL